MGSLKQRCDVVSFTFVQDEARGTAPNALKAMNGESRNTKKEKTSVVKA